MATQRVPYSQQWIDDSDLAAVIETLQSSFLTQGPAVPAFENGIADLHKVAHVVATANATGALHMACLALGLSEGDRLWTSPNSFVASANCGRFCGAEVDFVDIDPGTRNMSVFGLAEKLEVAAAKGTLPKIVVPVDFAGFPCDMPAIQTLARRYGFRTIEDASHAVGATMEGKPVGAHADITVLSFHPVKIITTGEGGACLTNDAALARKLNLLRSHGITRASEDLERNDVGPWYYEQQTLGYNCRLTDIQAALGSSQLKRRSVMQDLRAGRVRRYDELLADLPLKLPARSSDRMSSHHLYVVEVEQSAGVSRATVFDELIADGISPNVHYIPIHLQPYYRQLGFNPGDFPAAEAYYAHAITLPLFPLMTDEAQDRVVASLHRILT